MKTDSREEGKEWKVSLDDASNWVLRAQKERRRRILQLQQKKVSHQAETLEGGKELKMSSLQALIQVRSCWDPLNPVLINFLQVATRAPKIKSLQKRTRILGFEWRGKPETRGREQKAIISGVFPSYCSGKRNSIRNQDEKNKGKNQKFQDFFPLFFCLLLLLDFIKRRKYAKWTHQANLGSSTDNEPEIKIQARKAKETSEKSEQFSSLFLNENTTSWGLFTKFFPLIIRLVIAQKEFNLTLR